MRQPRNVQVTAAERDIPIEVLHKQWSTWSKKDQQEYDSDFLYRNRKYYIPAAGTANWFAVKATSSSGSKDNCLLIFEMTDGTYKLTSAVYTDDGLAMPKIAVDSHGLAKVADPSTSMGTLAPSQLGKAFEDLYATGGKKAGKQLASTPATNQAYFAAKPAHPKVYASSTCMATWSSRERPKRSTTPRSDLWSPTSSRARPWRRCPPRTSLG